MNTSAIPAASTVGIHVTQPQRAGEPASSTGTARENSDIESFSLHETLSNDGTRIGYRRYGRGPGLVIEQGAMGTAQNYDELARLLAGEFTVYVPDRRGRRLSAREFTADHVIERDVEDLEAVLAQTQAHFVLGLSSGAIITAECARRSLVIHRAALYEPPFYYQERVPVERIERIYEEIARGDYAAALATVNSVVKVGPAVLGIIPHPLLRVLTGLIIAGELKRGTGEYASLRELIPSMRYDFKAVLGRGDQLPLYKTLEQEVLLLGGDRSPRYLKRALTGLQLQLPRSSRIEFPGLDHSALWNRDKGGAPQVLAPEIVRFFKKHA
jgi:pimeloyl-ACP methyl ester carboxylesterase